MTMMESALGGNMHGKRRDTWKEEADFIKSINKFFFFKKSKWRLKKSQVNQKSCMGITGTNNIQGVTKSRFKQIWMWMELTSGGKG